MAATRPSKICRSLSSNTAQTFRSTRCTCGQTGPAPVPPSPDASPTSALRGDGPLLLPWAGRADFFLLLLTTPSLYGQGPPVTPGPTASPRTSPQTHPRLSHIKTPLLQGLLLRRGSHSPRPEPHRCIPSREE